MTEDFLEVDMMRVWNHALENAGDFDVLRNPIVQMILRYYVIWRAALQHRAFRAPYN